MRFWMRPKYFVNKQNDTASNQNETEIFCLKNYLILTTEYRLRFWQIQARFCPYCMNGSERSEAKWQFVLKRPYFQ